MYNVIPCLNSDEMQTFDSFENDGATGNPFLSARKNQRIVSLH